MHLLVMAAADPDGNYHFDELPVERVGRYWKNAASGPPTGEVELRNVRSGDPLQSTTLKPSALFPAVEQITQMGTCGDPSTAYSAADAKRAVRCRVLLLIHPFPTFVAVQLNERR